VDEPHILKRLMAGENVGTTVLPAKKKSNVKRWIASHTASHEGRVVVNEKLYALLKEQGRVMSLLPVGIQSAEGDFKKGDLIEIASPSGEIIGVGVARYDMKKLMDYCGKKEKPPLIHYDYLHLF
jgi:glutamate 5-kinase